MDDGSKDNCGKICDEYAAMDSRFRVIHKENGGLTSARNAGLAMASGEWVMHLDGDDWIAAVTPKPVRTPLKGLEVIVPRSFLRPFPAVFWRPVLIMFIP